MILNLRITYLYDKFKSPPPIFIKTDMIVTKSARVTLILFTAATNMLSLGKSAGKNSDTLVLTIRLCGHFLGSSVNDAASESELQESPRGMSEISCLVITDEQDDSEISLASFSFCFLILLMLTLSKEL